jgi:hypothetical protein
MLIFKNGARRHKVTSDNAVYVLGQAHRTELSKIQTSIKIDAVISTLVKSDVCLVQCGRTRLDAIENVGLDTVNIRLTREKRRKLDTTNMGSTNCLTQLLHIILNKCQRNSALYFTRLYNTQVPNLVGSWLIIDLRAIKPVTRKPISH